MEQATEAATPAVDNERMGAFGSDDGHPGPAPAPAGPDLPADLNRAGILSALASVHVDVDGDQVPILDVLRMARCRPGKPLNGCQGAGFSLSRATPAGKAKLTLCGCALLAWRRARDGAPLAAPVLSVRQARAEEQRDTHARERVGRKLEARAKVESELQALLEGVGAEVSSLAQDLANADAREAVHRGRAAEAAEWVRNCDQRIAELEKLRTKALTDGQVAFDDEVAAHAEAAAIRVKIEAAREAHGSEERALRRRIEKLGNRAQRILERHPEAASPS